MTSLFLLAMAFFYIHAFLILFHFFLSTSLLIVKEIFVLFHHRIQDYKFYRAVWQLSMDSDILE